MDGQDYASTDDLSARVAQLQQEVRRLRRTIAQLKSENDKLKAAQAAQHGDE